MSSLKTISLMLRLIETSRKFTKYLTCDTPKPDKTGLGLDFTVTGLFCFCKILLIEFFANQEIIFYFPDCQLGWGWDEIPGPEEHETLNINFVQKIETISIL